MPGPEELEPVPAPDDELWSSIDTVVHRELQGGHQSRVFAGQRRGSPVVVKLVDQRLVDAAFTQRVVMTSALAESDESVVGPIAHDGQLVRDLRGWLAVIYPFIDGREPDIDDEDDVRRMATQMASLHQSLEGVGLVDLPPAAALTDPVLNTPDGGFGPRQVIHGDFSRGNLLFSDGRVRVLDFADCGYGPIEFDVGNTLYMELFDAFICSNTERFERFRTWFVDAYRLASRVEVTDQVIDDAIDIRVGALAHWIDRPESAPIGIRTATPAWRETLRSFVDHQRRR